VGLDIIIGTTVAVGGSGVAVGGMGVLVGSSTVAGLHPVSRKMARRKGMSFFIGYVPLWWLLVC
jgi:hypothetical protein